MEASLQQERLLDWTWERRRVDVALKGGPSGAAHLSDSCTELFIEIAAELGASWKLSPKFQGDPSDSRQMDSYSISVVGPNCRMGRKMRQSRANLCIVLSWLHGRRTRTFEFSSSEGAECEKDSETFSAKLEIAAPPPKRQCQAKLQATMLAHMEEFAGRLAALEVSGVAPTPTPCSACPAKLGIPADESQAAQRHTRLALCLEPVRHQSHPSPCQANSRGPTKKRCASPPIFRPCRSTCKAGFSAGQIQKRTLTGGRVRSGSGSGDNRGGVHQGSQRRRIRRERGPATERPCPGAAHSAHPSRMPWGYHYGARDESAGSSDDSPRGILELATTLKRALPSSLWSFPNSTKSHRDGRRIGGLERQHAMLCQIDGSSPLAQGSQEQEPLRRRPRRQPAKADSCCGETSH